MASYIPGDEPTVTILILGDDEVGKSTFLSRLAEGTSYNGASILRQSPGDASTLPTLHDLNQPFLFEIKMYNRPYRFEFYDTSSPTNYTLLKPDFLILTYDISRRSTLYSLATTWKSTVEGHFNYKEDIPIMVLGLKRDLRREWTTEEREKGVLGESVMPQEGVRVASEMRCDKYAECSALTGELCREVLEDVAKVAAMTTTVNGGRTPNANCVIL
ncbi:P-loop containing nucleoside triphosphate hydrolase protein [Tothia fuscella]|uniref:P-loop containing nucleoside triphosphate hydrolase protein n=1 Tax=Tothia fuscella TaxID=1048955 RepID=A0A9P4NM38_9PEZI|nr:P-loop containing nucleoside triphosphate hydrolase protein [Tothia fuscella]